MRNASYDGLAVWFGTALWEQQVAGYHSVYNKTMIMETGIDADKILKNKWTVVVCPAKRTPADLVKLRRDIDRSGLLLKEYISVPLAATKYYMSQEQVERSAKEILVLDIQSNYSELSLVESNNGKIRLAKVQRVPIGKNRLVEMAMVHFMSKICSDSNCWSNVLRGELVLKTKVSKVLEHMLECRRYIKSFSVEIPEWKKKFSLKLYREDVDNFCKRLLDEVLDESFLGKKPISGGAKGFFEKAKVCCGLTNPVPMILLGEFFQYDDGVNLVREIFPQYQVLSYKPVQAAVLGAAAYAHEKGGCRSVVQASDFSAKEVKATKPMELMKSLDLDVQKAYLQIKEAIEASKMKVRFCLDNTKVLSDVAEALVYDHPELEIAWNYDESGLYVYEYSGEMELKPFYNKGWKELLMEIDWKVDEIIRKCIGRQQLSDQEQVNRIYSYISQNYIYAAKGKDGEWASSVSSIEAVLGSGICAGYSKIMTYCLKKLQIPVVSVLGDANGQTFGGHAWNIYQMTDGTYTHLDVTWDLGKKVTRAKYFAIDDTAMRARRHFWKPLDYPVCAF